MLKILNVKSIFNTTKNFRANLFSWQAPLLKNPECEIYIQYSEKFQVKFCFQGKRKLFKILNVKSIFTTVKIFGVTLCFFFRASASYSKIVNCEKIFNAVYIHLGAIRVIWASVVCNQDQRRDWL